VHVLAAKGRSVTTASRYVKQVHPFPPLDRDPKELVAALRDAAARARGRPVLFVTGDRSLRFLSRHRAAFEDLVDHDLADPEVIEDCLHKDRFSIAAERLQLPVPRTWRVQVAEDARRLVTTAPFPVFAKPVHREDWAKLPPGTVATVKGQQVDTADELARLFEILVRNDGLPVVVQSLVAGPDAEHLSVHAYVAPDGRLLGTFTGRKLRVWPPHAGVGTCVRSERLEEPIALATRTLAALRYIGYAILQFKRDAGTGQYLLIEINCRYGTWSELPLRCGCNLPAVAYATMTGQEPPAIEQRVGPSWLDWQRDFDSWRSTYRPSGEWGWGAYLRSLLSVRCGAIFALDDLGPWLYTLTHGRSE